MTHQLSLLGMDEPSKEMPFRFIPGFLSKRVADSLMESSLILPWRQNSIQTRFKSEPIPLPRLEWMAGDRPGEMRYVYSGSVELVADPWPDMLTWLRRQIEERTSYKFQVVVGNRYEDGRHHIGWHSDDEKTMGVAPVIASVSLGATRIFKLKPKDNSHEPVSFEASHGTLILMEPGCQERYLHCITKTTKPVGCRINFTFRPWAD